VNSTIPDTRGTWIRRRSWIGLALLALIALGSILLVRHDGIGRSILWLADREQHFEQLLGQRPVVTYLSLFLLYVLVTGASIPGATLLSLLVAFVLGFWRGLLLVSFASTLGATLAMLMGRYLFRAAVTARLAGRYEKVFRQLENDGPYYLFAMRLTPYVPYFAINLLMGLTTIRAWTFWWVSQLGMLPITCLYLFAGSNLPGFRQLAEHGPGQLLTPSLVLALLLVAIAPLAIRRLVKWRLGVG
jgi:uncharacterized membrane protein YdjX (TVP38/TMEM64 family)